MRRKVVARPAMWVLVATLAGGAPALARPGADGYERLLAHRFTKAPQAVPAAGLSWTVDGAVFTLESGRLWWQEATDEGAITGVVFSGRGHLRMAVPDPVELRQLRRFAREPELTELSETFSAMVLRAAVLPQALALAATSAPAGPLAPNKLARERHRHWLVIRRHDADSRVIAALANPGERYLRADLDTSRGWLTYQLDGSRHEEVTVEKFQLKRSVLESWLSLDLDRGDDGRPRDRRRRQLDIEHVRVTADLTRGGRETAGLSRTQSVIAELAVDVEASVLGDDLGALRFYLHPRAEVQAVRDAAGTELGFVRNPIGRASSALDNDLYSFSLVVFPERPARRGERLVLRFAYELELFGYAPGRIWYPTADPGLTRDVHTAELALTAQPGTEVRSMGRRLDAAEDGTAKDAARRWRIDTPVKMATFSFARRHFEDRRESATGPTIIPFGSLGGRMSRQRIGRVADNAAASVAFFEEMLGPLGSEELFVTLVPAAHGQAFAGFLHIGDLSTASSETGADELFGAHEVAHQWWGHAVGVASYRHQWLSEGIAEYTAMMFVEATMADGEKLFRQIVKAYGDELVGSIESALSQFSRPGLTMLNRVALERIGPIGHGWRSRTAEAPAAFLSQVYVKGALVMHMLRGLLRDRVGDAAGGDAELIGVLRDFLARHRGGFATTGDFRAVVEERTGEDWKWFFDQWIYGAEIPTYRWSWRQGGGADGDRVELEIEQRGVSDGFRMPLTVRITTDGGVEDHTVLVDSAENRFDLASKGTPRKVELDPDNFVLARIKKR